VSYQRLVWKERNGLGIGFMVVNRNLTDRCHYQQRRMRGRN